MLATRNCGCANWIHKRAFRTNDVLKIKAAKGRLELARNYNGAEIYIDYAHTPDSLKTVLHTLRKSCKGELHVLFGCGGQRDITETAIRIKDSVKIYNRDSSKRLCFPLYTSGDQRMSFSKRVLEEKNQFKSSKDLSDEDMFASQENEEFASQENEDHPFDPTSTDQASDDSQGTLGSQSIFKNSQCGDYEDFDDEILKMPKYVVFSSSLLILFKFCNTCGAPISDKRHFTNGAAITVKTICLNGHSFSWCSSPMVGPKKRSYAINILQSVDTFIIGSTYETVSKFFNRMRIACIGKTHYYSILSKIVYKVVWYIWTRHQTKLFQDLREIQETDEIQTIGDGSYDRKHSNV